VIGGKIPYSIEMKDDSPFVFAGLWEGWQNPETQEWLRTCSIITGQPNEFVAEIHTRMPVILPPETHERRSRKGDFDTVPGPRDENKTCLNTDKQTRK
jgi:putative SOS response-associated peptidase YedK